MVDCSESVQQCYWSLIRMSVSICTQIAPTFIISILSGGTPVIRSTTAISSSLVFSCRRYRRNLHYWLVCRSGHDALAKITEYTDIRLFLPLLRPRYTGRQQRGLPRKHMVSGVVIGTAAHAHTRLMACGVLWQHAGLLSPPSAPLSRRSLIETAGSQNLIQRVASQGMRNVRQGMRWAVSRTRRRAARSAWEL